MDPNLETRQPSETEPASGCPAIVWETTRAPSIRSLQSFDQLSLAAVRLTEPDARDRSARSAARVAAPVIRRFVDHWSAVLCRPSFAQVHGSSPMETTRIVRVSGSQAADVLDRVVTVAWGRGRTAGNLRLGPFRAAPAQLGQPWVADAVLRGQRLCGLRVSVAIHDYGNERCGIQIRPDYRRPWSSRRLRRCLRSTHGAVDRLGELVLAVDFMPPRHAADDILSA